MKIKVETFVEKIENSDFRTAALETLTIKKAVSMQVLNHLFEQFRQFLEQNKLARVSQPLLFEDEEVIVSLESGIINLPFANSNRVDNFFENDEETAVIVNLIVEAADVNASGLRIDSFGTVADYLTAFEQIDQALVHGINEQLNLIAENRKGKSED
ncbi:hypothetical protein JCM15457_1719 [Liquorilactobacillus sucicola DSM 21376 = JCM 15457]|uniref:Uncharacterized protein n=1 Tax=Liquorilactobacillus sucicola DSM 21376 = JCM 15457 TaxID=1423806 RepID=A0A023CY18_9LACO|nr:hypothetical protein [Liquorilactobacillus sucicola]KRN07597.1 hypothetical protein FD15_GL000886 [Liquorilactobacillus sucicola DSM 21376 = JCM 15457]GAJ26772.1 hypothetical protein JCM15457_1719 [Liquorilactobacillus sucicola DSM 21376 = JCM 15457]